MTKPEGQRQSSRLETFLVPLAEMCPWPLSCALAIFHGLGAATYLVIIIGGAHDDWLIRGLAALFAALCAWWTLISRQRFRTDRAQLREG